MKQRQAEITIAQTIGEVRQLILFSVLYGNPKLSYEQALEKAEAQTEDIFLRLEDAYRNYFSKEE